MEKSANFLRIAFNILLNLIVSGFLAVLWFVLMISDLNQPKPYELSLSGTFSEVSAKIPQLIFNTYYSTLFYLPLFCLIVLISVLLLVYFVLRKKVIIYRFFLIFLTLIILLTLWIFDVKRRAKINADDFGEILKIANFHNMPMRYKLTVTVSSTSGLTNRETFHVSFDVSENIDKVFSYYQQRFPASEPANTRLGQSGFSREIYFSSAPAYVSESYDIKLVSNGEGLTNVTFTKP